MLFPCRDGSVPDCQQHRQYPGTHCSLRWPRGFVQNAVCYNGMSNGKVNTFGFKLWWLLHDSVVVIKCSRFFSAFLIEKYVNFRVLHKYLKFTYVMKWSPQQSLATICPHKSYIILLIIFLLLQITFLWLIYYITRVLYLLNTLYLFHPPPSSFCSNCLFLICFLYLEPAFWFFVVCF